VADGERKYDDLEKRPAAIHTPGSAYRDKFSDKYEYCLISGGVRLPSKFKERIVHTCREATWEPHEKHGRLTTHGDLPDSVYAFPKQRKEPLTDAQHVRNAVARFDQVIDVSDADRAVAFANIEKAANYYDVDRAETSWHDLGIYPQ
jgi:hypothetical protein